MAKLEGWEKTNIFRSLLAEECFNYDVLESIAHDYETYIQHKGKSITRNSLENALYETIENIHNTVEWFLDEYFEGDMNEED